MRSVIVTRHRSKLATLSPPEKTYSSVMQTQSTVHQLVTKIREQNQQQEKIVKERKPSFNSIMEEDLFGNMEELDFGLGGEKVVKEDKIQLNIEETKNCVGKGIVKELMVISSFRVRPMSLCFESMSYYYQKLGRSLSFETKAKKDKDKYTSLMMLMDIYKKYSQNYLQDYKFYVIYSRSLFCFTSNKGTSSLVAYSPDLGLSKVLDTQNIHHQCFPSAQTGQSVVISDRNISVFWNYFMNLAIVSEQPFQIISNFDFAGASKNYAVEIFNGFDTREIFKKSKEFEDFQQVYHLRMEGLMTEDSVRRMVKCLDGYEGVYMLEYKFMDGSDMLDRTMSAISSACSEESD